MQIGTDYCIDCNGGTHRVGSDLLHGVLDKKEGVSHTLSC